IIFPSQLSDLEGDYVPTCTEADNQEGMCFRYNQTPWGEIADSDYAVIGVPNALTPTHYRAELTLNLPDKNNEALGFDRDVTLQLFAQMPNVIYDDTANTIILRIDRPDKAFAYESLVKRSGDDSTLLGDWDVGGEYAITNVKDITIKNSNGTQTVISDGLVNVFSVKHDDIVDRPNCPKGKESIINLMIGEITTPKEHTSTGRIRAYLKSTSATQWRVGLDNIIKRDRDGVVQINHSGYLTAITQCKTP
ncbi:type II secretion system protein, partial [Aliivibrio salmonicida]|uniref:type II secretion system protein n=1 Tax=Aliivibrio salmonicida TaxID=40269 RepID=UPI003D10B950